MSSPKIAPSRFRFTLRSLFAALTALSILLGFFTAIYRWQAVKSNERRAQAALAPHAGVYSMTSALYSVRTQGQSQGWFFETFLNYVEAVETAARRRFQEIRQ